MRNMTRRHRLKFKKEEFCVLCSVLRFMSPEFESEIPAQISRKPET